MPKAKDYSGQRFGSLTIISKEPSKSGHTYWLCKCDCGKEKVIQTSHFTSGVTKSCGECEGRNLIDNLNRNKDLSEKQCLICKKSFIPNVFNRLYCYDCSPEGLSPAEALRHKKRALKHLLIAYKGGKCENCGYDKCEGALHFHHINPKEKEFSISQINLNDTNFSLEKIFLEVDKCKLLCANCHAEVHYDKNDAPLI